MSELDFSAMRAAMVSNQLRTNKVNDPRVVTAMKVVARERFVSAERAALAYVDVPIPLGHGRALNSPLLTARLIAESAIEPGEKVLLIGAATGYAAALLQELGANVTALEVDESLAAIGKAAGLRYVVGPLEAGWRKGAPYDVVLIDGAVSAVPTAISAQLADGGRLLAGLIDRGVTRLALGRKSGQGVSLVAFADLEAVELPGFSSPESFSF